MSSSLQKEIEELEKWYRDEINSPELNAYIARVKRAAQKAEQHEEAEDQTPPPARKTIVRLDAYRRGKRRQG